MVAILFRNETLTSSDTIRLLAFEYMFAGLNKRFMFLCHLHGRNQWATHWLSANKILRIIGELQSFATSVT
jgi:hypothetical protein